MNDGCDWPSCRDEGVGCICLSEQKKESASPPHKTHGWAQERESGKMTEEENEWHLKRRHSHTEISESAVTPIAV